MLKYATYRYLPLLHQFIKVKKIIGCHQSEKIIGFLDCILIRKFVYNLGTYLLS